MDNKNSNQLIEELGRILKEEFEKGDLIKVIVSKPRSKNNAIRSIEIKPIILKNEMQLSFIEKYQTKEIRKNFNLLEGENKFMSLLENDFLNANLFSIDQEFIYQSNIRGKAKLQTKKLKEAVKNTDLQHNKTKKRLIEAKDNPYLKALEITDENGRVKDKKQFKYKQINLYIELLKPIIESSNLEKFKIVDMGSGKGYLTFALYDFLNQNYPEKVEITGVELRDDLVNFCNSIAKDSGFKNLKFETGSIEKNSTDNFNVLVALHACDTATDEAIYKGIKSGAEIIAVSPCCHKQIRRDMKSPEIIEEITNYGIFKERQAEILTDTLRVLILELYGYNTKVMEFIESQHTPKNTLITAQKRAQSGNKEIIEQKIKGLKNLFGIEEHYLETLLKKDAQENS